MAEMKHPETRIGELCAELGISRQTLYKHLTPQGELRPLGQKLLDKRKL
jgi:transcriptional antiterminator